MSDLFKLSGKDGMQQQTFCQAEYTAVLRTAALYHRPYWAMVYGDFAKTLRAEAAEFGIKVSVLCSGAVKTPILEGRGINGRLPTSHAARAASGDV